MSESATARDIAIELGHDVDRTAHDLASWRNVTPDEAVDALRAGLRWDINHLRKFGISVNPDRAMKHAAIRYNHGRARKVSFRRPSPRLSRSSLEQIKAMAILEATLEQV